jgi:hypothetical protein
MNNTRLTINNFTDAMKEYIDVNGSGQAMGYLYGVLSNLQLQGYELETLQTFTKGLQESVQKTLSNASRSHQQHGIEA